MITRQTTLILGAGASANFGYPSGQSLLAMLVAALAPTVTGGELIDVLLQLGYSRADVNHFQQAVAGSGAESIDALLEYRPDLVDLGKAAIAAALIVYEQPDRLQNYGEASWYRYLLQRILAPWEQFDQNKLSIVTF